MNTATPLITICTVNHNSSEFIEVMLESFKILTHNPYKVIIRDSNSRQDDLVHLREIASRYDNVFVYEVKTSLMGSMEHGTGLNDLVQQIDTPYGVVMDADALFLKKDWDQFLIDRLDEHQPIYGTQADVGSGKPEDFPLMFAVLFRTDVLKSLKVDFRPSDISKYQDTGWDMRQKYQGHGYIGGLLYSFNTRTFKKGPFADIISSEYYDTPDASGPIFVAHFGRGSAPSAKRLVGIRGNTVIHRIMNKALWYVNLIKWKRDKKRWIAIARSIINAYGRKI